MPYYDIQKLIDGELKVASSGDPGKIKRLREDLEGLRKTAREERMIVPNGPKETITLETWETLKKRSKKRKSVDEVNGNN